MESKRKLTKKLRKHCKQSEYFILHRHFLGGPSALWPTHRNFWVGHGPPKIPCGAPHGTETCAEKCSFPLFHCRADWKTDGQQPIFKHGLPSVPRNRRTTWYRQERWFERLCRKMTNRTFVSHLAKRRSHAVNWHASNVAQRFRQFSIAPTAKDFGTHITILVANVMLQ
jgi:hypothetical protein